MDCWLFFTLFISLYLGTPRYTASPMCCRAITSLKLSNPRRCGMVRFSSSRFNEPYHGVSDLIILNEVITRQYIGLLPLLFLSNSI
ncbi:unnamed protein product [Meloidogyne enterolobii]|uniref:Uncharacterized protein n=1 Tax=Meloidogyne enterolobii TaxID=390850 RepID=A0ACB0Y8Z4_MELEN